LKSFQKIRGIKDMKFFVVKINDTYLKNYKKPPGFRWGVWYFLEEELTQEEKIVLKKSGGISYWDYVVETTNIFEEVKKYKIKKMAMEDAHKVYGHAVEIETLIGDFGITQEEFKVEKDNIFDRLKKYLKRIFK